MNELEKLKKLSLFETLTTNEETLEALCEGLDDDLTKFSSVEELMRDLNDEDNQQKQ